MKITVKTAPEKIYPEDYLTSNTVFLAGGITDCYEWQDLIIRLLMKTKDDLNRDILILNPRRLNFPMGDPGETDRQIEWEFDALMSANIFSVWFANSSSVQPITLYELGRQVVVRKKYPESVVVGAARGYLRRQDVCKQLALVDSTISERISVTMENHAENIRRALKDVDSNHGGDLYERCQDHEW